MKALIKPKQEELQALYKKLAAGIKRPASEKKLLLEFIEHYVASPPPGASFTGNLEGHAASINSLFEHTMSTKAGKVNLRMYRAKRKRQIYIDLVSPNMPFTVASLLNLLLNQGIYVYSQQNFQVDVDYRGNKINSFKGGKKIMIIRLIVEFLSDKERADLRQLINHLCLHLKHVTSDWEKLVAKFLHVTTDYKESYQHRLSAGDKAKLDFLEWLKDNKCLFLGYGEYLGTNTKTTSCRLATATSPLGLCAVPLRENEIKAAMEKIKPTQGINFWKLPVVSLIHRRVYIHCISVGIKQGNEIREHRFLLLYAFDFFNSRLEEIPYIKDGFERQFQRLNIHPNSYRWRVLRYSLACYPRDELLQILEDKSFDYVTDRMMEAFSSTAFRSMVYYDKRKTFINVNILVPRDDYGTEVRYKFEELLRREIGSTSNEFNVLFSEERLARLFLTFPLSESSPMNLNHETLEKALNKIGRGWRSQLRDGLMQRFGDDEGIHLYKDYADVFGTPYKENFSAAKGAEDMQHIISIGSGEKNIVVNFLEQREGEYYRLRLIGRTKDVSLSALVHILENAGAEPITSRPYFFYPEGEMQDEVRLLEFQLSIKHAENLKPQQFKESFESCLVAVYEGLAEDDGFNSLAINAAMGYRDIMLLRAMTNYLAQVQSEFSRSYIQDTLCQYPRVAAVLARIFNEKFDLGMPKIVGNTGGYRKLNQEFEKLLRDVPSLEQDQILRQMLEVISSMRRTNFFKSTPATAQTTEAPYVSFKLQPNRLSFCKEEQPQQEIFIYSPDFEGVHLRYGDLARGGIRWSDKRAGYRNEIYQLMVAQVIKNAIIIPTGAKGGFYIKNPDKSAQEIYSSFIRALLELTDNYVSGRPIAAKGVKAYDGKDPYLVVAPDKGTADFSDIANEIARGQNFWLDDAFASSGSSGYSHKDMGITARGAWESVKRSFAELGVDVGKESVEVIGVGDMSGDVFGNGMLLSRSIKLICAFNHRNIFIDPNPDPAKSFQERKRLFDLPGSTWEDYAKSKMSRGGEIFSRSAKKLKLSPIIREKFGIHSTQLSPNQLLRRILKAPADLLWFGGIGTYVKGSKESNLDIRDKPNDAIRVDANQLRVKVIGEGANLGASLAGRVEFDQCGGIVATDSNDNSGGVHCSDQEVNIKILLNLLRENGKKIERRKLLRDMTEQVARGVLAENVQQNLALSLERHQAQKLVVRHLSLATKLEALDDIGIGLNERPQYLTRPQLAVLFGLQKNLLKAELAKHSLPDDPRLRNLLIGYFPHQLAKYSAFIPKHFLAKQILNTRIVNLLVDRLGLAFWDDLSEADMQRLPNYVTNFLLLDEVFGFSKIMDQLAENAKQYDRDRFVAIQTGFSMLLRYQLGLNLSDKDNKLLYEGLAGFLTQSMTRMKKMEEASSGKPKRGKGKSKAKERAKEPAMRLGHAELKKRVVVLRSGVQYFIAADLTRHPSMQKFSPAQRYKLASSLVIALQKKLSLEDVLQALANQPAEGLWQMKGINLMQLELLEELHRIAKRLIPAYVVDADATLNGWEMQKSQNIAGYDRCLQEFLTQHDVAVVNYLLNLLKKC